ncbi:MAG: type II toxin-antitoxin system YoeB family toxin [Lachnospiraceae bacterium]|nr:type II toxin-antitoxin system YoeB family toxin [Lachnospiraceae bacterium]
METYTKGIGLDEIGKPEPLRYRPGYSRRIDDVNRLVYEVDELQNIKIISCRGHYDDK